MLSTCNQVIEIENVHNFRLFSETADILDSSYTTYLQNLQRKHGSAEGDTKVIDAAKRAQNKIKSLRH